MKLKEWRQTRNSWTMKESAKALLLADARSYQRYESGEQWPSAPIIERIFAVTHGQVTVEDLHRQRLEWLREFKPDAFDTEMREAAE